MSLTMAHAQMDATVRCLCGTAGYATTTGPGGEFTERCAIGLDVTFRWIRR